MGNQEILPASPTVGGRSFASIFSSAGRWKIWAWLPLPVAFIFPDSFRQIRNFDVASPTHCFYISRIFLDFNPNLGVEQTDMDKEEYVDKLSLSTEVLI